MPISSLVINGFHWQTPWAICVLSWEKESSKDLSKNFFFKFGPRTVVLIERKLILWLYLFRLLSLSQWPCWVNGSFVIDLINWSRHWLIKHWWSLACVCNIQQVTKRHLRRSKSLVSVMLWGSSEEFESDKAKNVRQTEILVDLREAILQVARHFQSIDPRNSRVVRTSWLFVYNYTVSGKNIPDIIDKCCPILIIFGMNISGTTGRWMAG